MDVQGERETDKHTYRDRETEKGRKNVRDRKTERQTKDREGDTFINTYKQGRQIQKACTLLGTHIETRIKGE